MTEPDREIRYISFIVTQAKSLHHNPPSLLPSHDPRLCLTL